MTCALFQQADFLQNPPAEFPDFFPDFLKLCRSQAMTQLTPNELDFKSQIRSGVEASSIEDRFFKLKNFARSLSASGDVFRFLRIIGSQSFYEALDLGVAHFHDEAQYPDHPSQLVREGITALCRHLASRCPDEILQAIAGRDATFEAVNAAYGLTYEVEEFQVRCAYNTTRWQLALQIFCDQAEVTIGFSTALELLGKWCLEQPLLLREFSRLGRDYSDKMFRLCYSLKRRQLTGAHRSVLHSLLSAGWQRAIPALVDLIAFDEERCEHLLRDPRTEVQGAATLVGLEKGYLAREARWREALETLLTFDLRPAHRLRAERIMRLLPENP